MTSFCEKLVLVANLHVRHCDYFITMGASRLENPGIRIAVKQIVIAIYTNNPKRPQPHFVISLTLDWCLTVNELS